MTRPALLPFDHPLVFPNSLQHQSVAVNPQPGYSKQVSPTSSLANPQTVEDKISYLYEHQRVIDLLNEYCYTLDATSVDTSISEIWSSLFTEDGEATYPFGTHKGRKGLAEWGMTAETRFYRMQHLQSNFTVTFESNDVAHGRTACICTHGSDENDLSKHFMVGGYYYFTFRRVHDGPDNYWKISRLILDTNWESGASLGLFEKREGNHEGLDHHVKRPA
ncbi:hypothetical protein EV127DRAFT_487811 [Xylaria flabelliformis]|nr:hypothetical protein EV127DRAFT_487811 [Xylaria flabelliformis]